MDVREKLRFAAFEIDLQAHELLRNGRAVKVAPQALRLLEFLASHPGRLVSREEIRKEIWSDTTFVDFEQGINKSVRQIRDALNDDADKPRFVETLPRRGYRFIANIELPENDSAGVPVAVPPLATPPSPPPEFPAAHKPILSKHRVAAALGVLALIVAFLLSVRLERGRVSPAQPAIQSIAVLPFENLSADSSQDYFAAGITEELTTDLANIGAVRVISHTSAIQFQGGRKSLSQIARELKVDGIVEGAVQRSADRVRITAQLIRVAGDEHIWAATYDRQGNDMFGAEEDVARAIAGAVRLKLTNAQQSRLTTRAANAEALDLYLKGRYAWNERQPASLLRALDFFQRAVAIDPAFARGYAGLADTYALLGIAGIDGMPVSQAMEDARAAATKALELDDNLSDGHAALAYVSATYDWNWEVAEREYQRALELNPNNATAHQWYSTLLCFLGRWDQSIAEAKAAQSLDPLSPIVQEMVAYPYYYSHRYDDAMALSKKVLAAHPDFAISHLRLGREYAAKGMYAEAAAQFQRFSELIGGGSTLALASVADVRARSGNRKAAERLLSQLSAVARKKQVPAYQFAIIYSGLGNADETLKWLDRAYEERNSFLLYIRYEPLFDRVRTDPRFLELERRIGI
jgi:TolB-like protein/DNA-binding winged helix-turn-helix (wHTH) protein/Tfp pilus assembly protein PilF